MPSLPLQLSPEEGIGMRVFGYGSLVFDGWENGFQCEDRQVAELHDYRRVFNKASVRNWGTPEHPGPTLNLEKCSGASCKGIVFKFPDQFGDDVRRYLKRREWDFDLLEESVTLQDGSVEEAIVPVYNKEEKLLPDRSLEELATMAGVARGQSGRCREYVAMIGRDLAALGIDDPVVTAFLCVIQAGRTEGRMDSACSTPSAPAVPNLGSDRTTGAPSVGFGCDRGGTNGGQNGQCLLDA